MNDHIIVLAKRHWLVGVLSIVLFLVCFFYLLSEHSPSPSIKHGVSSASPNISSTAFGESESQSKQKRDAQISSPPIPITEEEKTIVAEKEALSAIADEGDRILDEFSVEAKTLFERDKQAQQALAELEKKAKGLAQ